MAAASKLSMLLTTPFPLLCSRPSALRLASQSRVSIALLYSNQRRKFSLNPRYRLGFFSVQASEGLHTQSTSVTRDETLVGFTSSRGSHPWPEWLKLVENLEGSGYFNRPLSSELHKEDAFQVFDELPEEFVRAANACLSFARERPELLRLLSKRDIEVVVDNGSPFMFQSAVDTARRMRSFLSKDGDNELEFGGAGTVDLMRFLLSYTRNLPDTPGHINLNNRVLIESSVRNLLNELGDASRRFRDSTVSSSLSKQVSDAYAQTPRPSGGNIEMKRGDWICPMCSFMNFAKNMKCLECKEARPKRLLTGGEWECPQCEFYNYGKNVVCLRCDCKRLGEATAGPRSGLGYSNRSNLNMADAANDVQAERWFRKGSQVDITSELNGSTDNESEIMPLRKGINRFVVNTKKTPLERSLLKDQFQENLGSDGSSKRNDLQAGDGMSSAKTSDASISESMDRLLGGSSSATEYSGTAGGESKKVTGKTSFSNISSPTLNRSKVSNSDVRFVPLPADMFAKPQKPKKEEQLTNNHNTDSTKADEVMGSSISSKSDDMLLLSERPVSQTESKEDKEQAEKSERWFKKVAELHDVTDLASAISDEDFPEIMPMRKGENRFVVSKKKDRSLTSPQYKRRMAMEQGSNTNFVPFVPFPPDYFAKKDKPSETEASADNAKNRTRIPTTDDSKDRTRTPASSTNPEIQGAASEKSEESSSRFPNYGAVADSVQRLENQQGSKDHRNTSLSGKSLNESKLGGGYEGREGNSSLRPSGTWKESTRSDAPQSTRQNSTQGQPDNSQNSRFGTDRGFSGKSLEGSLVKEPDPLDMSEEAKAERWFRRAAQIKDISELSQIPDEDFPEIMPMRKGVNRFVVSKRKTPLERRLTSPQYRRNLPIVSSEPLKKEIDTS